jgi:hypothetical protein
MNRRIPLLLMLAAFLGVAGLGPTVLAESKTLAGPSQKPVRVQLKREFVYGFFLFDGARYGTAFCPQAIATAYLQADVANVATVHRTAVYFWPITREYMADWESYQATPRGRLEVLRAGRVIRSLAPTRFSLRYAGGAQEAPTGLRSGDRAVRAVRAYRARQEDYNRAVADYYQQYGAYQSLAKRYLQNPAAFPAPPQEPREPEPPREYCSDLDEGFILKLPPGTYRIRLRDPAGKIVAGSERRVVAFAPSKHGVGYEVVPEEKWTYPLRSDDSSANLFIGRGRVIFLKPYAAARYNQYAYTKLTRLAAPESGRGQENKQTWATLAPLAGKGLTLQIRNGSKVIAEIAERPYYVRQSSGQALGYDIVAYDPGDPAAGGPTFAGYKIALRQGAGDFSLRLVDAAGREVPGSLRRLRVVSPSRTAPLYAMALFPLLVGAAILGFRRRRSGRSDRATEKGAAPPS